MNKSQYSSIYDESLKKFEYAQTPIWAGLFQTGELIAIRPVCENLRINASWQYKKISEHHEWSQLFGREKQIASDGKAREMLCLPPVSFQKWLISLQAIESENLNKDLLAEYIDGLVINLLLMLKISLDEVKRLRGVEREYTFLRQEVEEMIKNDDSGKEYTRLAKDHFKKQKEFKERIMERLNKDPKQLSLDF